MLRIARSQTLAHFDFEGRVNEDTALDFEGYITV